MIVNPRLFSGERRRNSQPFTLISGRLVAVALLLTGILGSAMAQKAGQKNLPVPMELPAGLQTATPVKAKNSDDVLYLSISMPYRDPKGMQEFVDAVSNPKSTSYRKFITPTEIGARFGLDAATVGSVVEFLSSRGMTIRLVGDNRLSILAEATVAQAEAAFQTKLVEYTSKDPQLSKGPTPFSFTSVPTVPSSIAPYIQYIGGLENFTRPVHRYLKPDKRRQLYAIAGLYDGSPSYRGTGRTIAVSNWDGYRLSNVPLFITYAGLPTPAGGSGSNISVVSISGSNGNTATTVQGEGDLDIQCVLGIAPLCNLVVYDNAGGSDLIGVLTREANDNTADIITESYGWRGGASFYLSAHNLHLAMNAQGITYMASSGDNGTADYVPSTGTPYPGMDPEVLMVGGTTVTTDASGNRATEVGWTGSGGGYSTDTSTFNVLPAYQNVSGVPATLKAKNKRLVPDVALDADANSANQQSSGYPIYVNGTLSLYYGTSASCPSTAAALALVEQSLIANSALSAGPNGTQRFGRIQDLLYSYNGDSSVFFDVTSGSNGTLPDSTTSSAAAGWDPVTGWGPIKFSGLQSKILTNPFLMFMTASPATIPTAGSSLVTVTINGPAPAGGAVISLTNSDTTKATIPASVTILAGQRSASFPVTGSATRYYNSVYYSVVITGTYNGVSTTTTVTIAPTVVGFQPGGLAVLQAGDGTSGLPHTLQTSVVQFARAALGQTAYTVLTFDNVTNTAAPSTGFLVNPVSLRGSLSRSPNGLFVSAFGHAMQTYGGASLDTSSASAAGSWGYAIPRTWMLFPFTGAYQNFLASSQTNLKDSNSFSTFGVSGAVTLDGTRAWLVGNDNRVNTATVGANSSSTVSTTVAGSAIGIANGNLFFTANAGTTTSNNGLYRISGTPTGSGNSALRIYAGNGGASPSPNAFCILDAKNALYSDRGTANSLVKLTLTNAGDTWDNLITTPTVGAGLTVTTLVTYSASSVITGLCSDGVNVYATATSASGGKVIAFPLTSSSLAIASAITLGTANTSNIAFLGISLTPEPSVVSASFNPTANVLTVAMRATSSTSGDLNGYGRAIKVGNVDFNTYRSISAVGSNFDYTGHIQTMKCDTAGNQYFLQTQARSTMSGFQYQIFARSAAGAALTGSAQVAAPDGFVPLAMAVNPSGNGDVAVLVTNGTQAQIKLFTNDGSGTLASGTTLDNGGSNYTLSSMTPVDITYDRSNNVVVLWTSGVDGGVSNNVAVTTYSGQTQSQIGSTLSTLATRAIAFSVDTTGRFQVLSSATGSASGSNGAFVLDAFNSGFTTRTNGKFQNRDNTMTNTVTGLAISRQLIPMGVTIDTSTNKPIVYFTGANGTPAIGTPDSQIGILGSFVAWRFSSGSGGDPEKSTFRFFPGINW